jgi:hypothetical protein
LLRLTEVVDRRLTRLAGHMECCVAAFGGEVTGESAERRRLAGLARSMDHEVRLIVDEMAGLGDPCFGRDDVVAVGLVPPWCPRARVRDSGPRSGWR